MPWTAAHLDCACGELCQTPRTPVSGCACHVLLRPALACLQVPGSRLDAQEGHQARSSRDAGKHSEELPQGLLYVGLVSWSWKSKGEITGAQTPAAADSKDCLVDWGPAEEPSSPEPRTSGWRCQTQMSPSIAPPLHHLPPVPSCD